VAHAYTPGLRVTRRTKLTRERTLPLKGEVTVKVGDIVRSDDIVARTELPGPVTILNVVNQLGIEPSEIRDFMLVKEGEAFKKDQPLAQNKPLFGIGFLKTAIKAPMDGTIENISEITGQVVLREPPQPVEVFAYFDGRVSRIIPEEGVELETFCSFVQGIFGIGSEVWGELRVAVSRPDEVLMDEHLRPEFKGKILVGGKHVSRSTYEKARQMGVIGIIVGGIHDQDVRSILGYDLGVAITGHEQIGTTLVTTEGFGEIPMAEKTFTLLKERDGQRASLSGATQIRAGVIRPEVIIPYPQADWASMSEEVHKGAMAVQVGDAVRIIREPYFGVIGSVAELTPALERVESETKVRVLEVKLPDGSLVKVPRANIERIED
jgi:transcription antitermination factor NusG